MGTLNRKGSRTVCKQSTPFGTLPIRDVGSIDRFTSKEFLVSPISVRPVIPQPVASAAGMLTNLNQPSSQRRLCPIAKWERPQQGPDHQHAASGLNTGEMRRALKEFEALGDKAFPNGPDKNVAEEIAVTPPPAKLKDLHPWLKGQVRSGQMSNVARRCDWRRQPRGSAPRDNTGMEAKAATARVFGGRRQDPCHPCQHSGSSGVLES